MNGLVKLQPVEPRVTAGRRATFGEAVSSGFRSAFAQGSVSESRRHSEVYGDWKPIFDRVVQGHLDLPPELGQSLAEQGFSPDAETLGNLAKWVEAEGSQYGYSMTPEMSADAVEARRAEVYARDTALIEREQEVLNRASPFSRTTGGIVGGIGAEFLDPINIATLPAGAPARVGLLGTVLIEAGLNAGIEAADTPHRNAIARRLGQKENTVLENAAMGALFGGVFAGAIKGGEMGVRQLARLGRMVPDRKALLQIAEASGDADAAVIASALRRDLEEEEMVSLSGDRGEVREHAERAQAVAEAAHTGGDIDLPERPTFATPRASIINGQIEEVSPRDLQIQPEVFQFKSDTVAPGGVTAKLRDVDEWRPERAGITIVYEYADGTRAVADGHQRTALANRLMDGGAGDIRLAARVFRAEDGFTPDDVRVMAALKNIAEAADGMTTAMARDAAKVLRVAPEAITQLPSGPGIARARSLSRLSDEAFDMFINEVVPERFSELVGKLVDDPQLHGAMMKLLERTRPETTAQAENILNQAMQAPIEKEVTADLFGEQEVLESLFLERAKVLERAMRIMREDQAVFRTLDEQAERIQEAGRNRLDTQTNRDTRQEVERALAAVRTLAHRAGPISEALNNGAQTYKKTGRLKDAAEEVAAAVRDEIAANGLSGAGIGRAGRDAKPAGSGAKTPDPLLDFDDPVSGQGVKTQIANTRIDPMNGNSLIAIRRSSGEVIGEFFDSQELPNFDQSKVALVRSGNYLARINSLSQSMDGSDAAKAAVAREFSGDPVVSPETRTTPPAEDVPSEPDLFGELPVGRGFDDDGNEIAVVASRADVAAELDADDAAVDVVDACVKG